MTQTASRLPDTAPKMPAVDAAPPALTIRSFGLTHVGKVRPSNEDHFLIAELARTLWVRHSSLPQPAAQYGRNRAHLLVVADGMGGHRAGEVASALAVETIENYLLHLLKRFSNLRAADEKPVFEEFQEALSRADARLFEESARHPELAGMGTTLTMALVSGRVLFVVHAGDSRCYLFREGTLRQLTADHNWAAELARHGFIKAEEVRGHRWQRVVYNILGGGDAGVQAEVRRDELEEGDVVLLCSDGLTDMLDDGRIAAILAAEGEPEAACRRLVDEANAAGGRDNITAVVGRLDAE